uniref:Uncharacterized protein n=1 Tax=Poecilia latipinna TaxID=48699 RepID=A0A3B3VGB8_9TELE
MNWQWKLLLGVLFGLILLGIWALGGSTGGIISSQTSDLRPISVERRLSGGDVTARVKRSLRSPVDKCLTKYSGIELNYTLGTVTDFQIDLCEVTRRCWSTPRSWQNTPLYLCGDLTFQRHCITQENGFRHLCPTWNSVTIRRGTIGNSPVKGQNPLVLTISSMQNSFFKKYPADSAVYLTLGASIDDKDPLGVIKINLVRPDGEEEMEIEVPDQYAAKIDYTAVTPLDIIQTATGYKDRNLWLNWMVQTAKETNIGNCIACATARPHLYTEPAPLHLGDSWGFNCMLKLTSEAEPMNCTALATIYPPINNYTQTGTFLPVKGKGLYVCFNFTHLKPDFNLGQISSDWCNVTLTATRIGHWARAGLYYFCGGDRLYVQIPPRTVGVCAMTRLAAPLMVVGERLDPVGPPQVLNSLTQRNKRQVRHTRSDTAFDLTTNSPTYIDAIGVPRGVPDQYKLADQIAAGFENLPVVSAFFPITPNKNVDRINYVHYNLLRLANLTRDAVGGLKDQLAPTSLMTIQNRMALDMLLAEKGGVCFMFQESCCTFIPNNTAPDGSVTRALEGLRILSKSMHEHSGIDGGLDRWFSTMFGKWKGIVMSLLVSVATFVAIVVTCGCCCVPCIRSLIIRLITVSIEKGSSGPPAPPPYQMLFRGAADEGVVETLL